MRVEMGTTLVIEAWAASGAEANTAIARAFAAVAQVAAQLHPEAPGSDLERIGAAAPGGRVPISLAAFEVLRFAQHLHYLSAGIFDPCLPSRSGRICDLELTAGAQPQAMPRAPMQLDCGGIAKGYAVDVAIEVLRRAGCAAGLVNAGGDLRIFGHAGEPLLLRAPGGAYRALHLRDGALAVSERTHARAPAGHRGYYLRAGIAAVRRYAAVRAADCMTADALTKCALLAPEPLLGALLGHFAGAHLEACA
jgi:thiamine biosynthesis lipoprotein